MTGISRGNALAVIVALGEILPGYVQADRLVGSTALLLPLRSHVATVERACEVARGQDRVGVLVFASRFMEFCGWAHQDGGDLGCAMQWTSRALDYAVELGDQRTIAYTLIGINLCFALKRLTEPEAWAEFVRADLGLDTVQFTFDLLDPWWPETQRRALIRRTRVAADACGLAIGSANVGLAHYVPSGLLDPDPAARAIARRWWRRACDVTGELGATAVGGPLGTLSVRDATDPAARAERYRDLLDSIEAITGHAVTAGIREFLIEPTPLAREIPSTITECQRLLADLQGRCPIPVGFTLDIGSAVFEPLHDPVASAASWIRSLGASIRMLRVNNTDRLGNPQWGWPHEQGRTDLASIVASIRAAGLDDIPAILEVYPRLEEDEEKVRHKLVRSVAYCHQHLGTQHAQIRSARQPE